MRRNLFIHPQRDDLKSKVALPGAAGELMRELRSGDTQQPRFEAADLRLVAKLPDALGDGGDGLLHDFLRFFVAQAALDGEAVDDRGR